MEMKVLKIRQQQGAVLAVSLIMLLLLTMLGITSMQTTSLEEKMAGNNNNLNLSFESSETALRIGEQFIDGLTAHVVGIPSCSAPCTNHIYSLGQIDPTVVTNWVPAAMTDLPAGTMPTTGTGGVFAQPMYYLEYEQFMPYSRNIGMASITGRVMYRVSGHGTGGNDLATTTLQTQFSKEFN